MPLKTWLFALVLFLMMAISGVVHSEEVIGIYGKPVQDGTTVDGIYYGNGYKADSSNLLIGGILQNSQDPDQNDQNYRTFADNNQAIYVPTYYAGNPSGSLQDQLNAIGLDCLEVNDAAQSIKTPMNGLSSPALNDKQYDTIIGYSGGTTTVVTAIAKQK